MRKSNWIISPNIQGENSKKYLKPPPPSIYIYLEPVCPLFWGLNPPKEGPFHSKQGSFRFKVYTYNLCLLTSIFSFNARGENFPPLRRDGLVEWDHGFSDPPTSCGTPSLESHRILLIWLYICIMVVI